MGRTLSQTQASVVVNQVPIGAVASVFRSGDAYKAAGELVRRSDYPDLSAAFPRNGSMNAVSLSITTAVSATGGWNSAEYGNGMFVVVGGSSSSGQGKALISTDGKNWDVAALPASGTWVGVKWGNGVFVALNSVGGVATSTDGLNWVSRGTIGVATASALAFGGGKFIAFNNAATTNQCYSSPDGINWTPRTLPATGSWNGLAYGGGTWVAVASDSTSAATSPDGINWTARVLPGATMTANNLVGYAFGQFIVGAKSTTNFTFYTSPDGINWAGKNVGGSTGGFNGCIYGDGTLIIFINDSTYSGYSIVSNDGVTFKMRKNGGLNMISGYGTTYGAGLFVTLGASNSVAASVENYDNSPTPSDYMYLPGSAGQFVRVK
jgi:hypothetical protein